MRCSISVDIPMRYLPKLTAYVEKKVAELLPGRFAVVSDRRSRFDTY